MYINSLQCNVISSYTKGVVLREDRKELLVIQERKSAVSMHLSIHRRQCRSTFTDAINIELCLLFDTFRFITGQIHIYMYDYTCMYEMIPRAWLFDNQSQFHTEICLISMCLVLQSTVAVCASLAKHLSVCPVSNHLSICLVCFTINLYQLSSSWNKPLFPWNTEK